MQPGKFTSSGTYDHPIESNKEHHVNSTLISNKWSELCIVSLITIAFDELTKENSSTVKESNQKDYNIMIPISWAMPLLLTTHKPQEKYSPAPNSILGFSFIKVYTERNDKFQQISIIYPNKISRQSHLGISSNIFTA